MFLSNPNQTPSNVTNEPVYLWDDPNRCFWRFPQLSQPFVPAVQTCLKLVAGIRFRIEDIFAKINRVYEVTHIIYKVFTLLSIG